MSTLIAFFSAEGHTAGIAKELAEKTGADLFEITPVNPYTAADIKWTNPLARCNREKFGNKDVPVAGRVEDFEAYDTVLIGFPIWSVLKCETHVCLAIHGLASQSSSPG